MTNEELKLAVDVTHEVQRLLRRDYGARLDGNVSGKDLEALCLEAIHRCGAEGKIDPFEMAVATVTASCNRAERNRQAAENN